MKTIGYAAWKGGTGKTLMSFNTIERAANAGLRTLGCDFDEQRILSRQCMLRERNGLDVTPLEIVEADITVQAIETLEAIQRESEYDLVVCDLPGADTLAMDRLLNALDAILVPVNGAPYELLNTARLMEKVDAKGWNAYLVPNNMPPTQKRAREAAADLEDLGSRIAPVKLVRRVTHWDAAREGLTACEYAPSSPAAAEIREYWAWLQGAVNIARNNVGRAKEVQYA